MAASVVASELAGVARTAVHPGGRTIAIVDRTEAARFLDAKTLKPVAEFAPRMGRVGAVAFTPDGRLGLIGTAAGHVVAFEVDRRRGTPR